MQITATNILTLALFITAASSCSESKSNPSRDAEIDIPSDAGSDLRVDLQSDVEVPDLGADSSVECITGCILDTQFLGAFSKEEIEAAVPPTVIVENGYAIYWVDYSTDGRTAHATVTIPTGLVSPPDDGWAIAVNNPGTVGVADKCAIAYSISGSGLSGYFGARGFVGVTIDYPGLGTDGLHPYLDAEVEGRASLDAIRATSELLRRLGTPHSGRAIIAGLSQGGHATLAAAAMQEDYAPELDIRAYSVVGPASVFLEHWQPGMTFDGPHLAYHALLTYAWSNVYEAGESPWATPLADTIDDVMTTHCNFATDTPALDVALGSDRAQIFSADFLDAFEIGDFSDFPFMATGFSKNRLAPFRQTAPIRIYQGDADIVVLESGTAELAAELQTGEVSVEYIVVPGGGHTDIAFSFLATPQLRTEEVITWLREQVQ